MNINIDSDVQIQFHLKDLFSEEEINNMMEDMRLNHFEIKKENTDLYKVKSYAYKKQSDKCKIEYNLSASKNTKELTNILFELKYLCMANNYVLFNKQLLKEIEKIKNHNDKLLNLLKENKEKNVEDFIKNNFNDQNPIEIKGISNDFLFVPVVLSKRLLISDNIFLYYFKSNHIYHFSNKELEKEISSRKDLEDSIWVSRYSKVENMIKFFEELISDSNEFIIENTKDNYVSVPQEETILFYIAEDVLTFNINIFINYLDTIPKEFLNLSKKELRTKFNNTKKELDFILKQFLIDNNERIKTKNEINDK